MQDIVVTLRADRAEIETLLTRSPRTPALDARLLDLLEHHCDVCDSVLLPALTADLTEVPPRIEDALRAHERVRQLVRALQDPEAVLSAPDSRWLGEHLEADESAILAPAARDLSDAVRAELADAAPALPVPGQEALAAGDEGASSDGDRSWAEAPVVSDPDVDRSVEATIHRTGGR